MLENCFCLITLILSQLFLDIFLVQKFINSHLPLYVYKELKSDMYIAILYNMYNCSCACFLDLCAGKMAMCKKKCPVVSL